MVNEEKLISVIEGRNVETQIEKRKWTSAIDQAGESLVSKGLVELVRSDSSITGSAKAHPTRGKAILKRMPSLKQAFILSEIFRKIGD